MPNPKLSEREQAIVTLAEKVMRWEVYGMNPGRIDNWQSTAVRCFDQPGWALARFSQPGHATINWDPFSNIADAWMLVDKLRERGLHVAIHSIKDGWYVGFESLHKSRIPFQSNASITEAICMAALATGEGKF